MYRKFCEMKTSLAISINKKWHSHQRFLGFKWGLPDLQSNRCNHSPGWLLRSSPGERSSHLGHLPLIKLNKEIRFGPRELRCIWKEWIQWAQRLASSICSMLNSFTWCLIFVSAAHGIAKSDWVTEQQQSLMFRLPSPFYKLYHLSPPLAVLEQFSQNCWDSVSWAWVLNIATEYNIPLFSGGS